MSRFYKNGLQGKVQDPPHPNYDQMWTDIEREVAMRRTRSLQEIPTPRSRRKFIPAAIVFSCFMVVAVPVFAGVTLNWDSLYGGRSVTNALNNGVGQRYNLDVSSKDITMSLKGVVTDGERMKILVSIDSDMKPGDYDAVELEHMVIKNEAGKEEPVNGYLNYDESSGKLLGIYETKDNLKKGKKTYTLEAGNLVYYKDKDIALNQIPKAGETLSTGEARYPSIRIKSVTESKSSLAVRYNVSAADSNDQGHGDPHLIVKTGSGSSRGMLTQLPPEDKDVLIEQVFSNLTAEEWGGAELHFNYMKEAKRIAGTWSFNFKADGKKASEAVYTQPLQSSDEFQQKAGMSLNQLTVTPLEIIASIQDDMPMKEHDKNGDVMYKDIRLMVGDQEITGSYTIKGDDPKKYQHVFAFESPEWYKDWSKVPMKMILKDAVVTKRDKSANWLVLNKPTAKKQTAEMKLESFGVHFDYYMDGNDLVVESESDSKGFKGISQSMLRVDGQDLYPEYTPRGPSAPSKNIERYPNFKMNQTLEINPGFYSYYDSSRDTEITLH